MLSGLKFIPRDQVVKAKDEKTKKTLSRKEKGGKNNKHSQSNSSDDEGLEKIKSGYKKKKKWYNSNDDMSSSSEESASQSEEEEREPKRDRKKDRRRQKGNKRHDQSSDNNRSKKKSSNRRKYHLASSDFASSSENEKSNEEGIHHKAEMRKQDENRGTNKDNVENNLIDDSRGSQSLDSNNIVRKELGLGWMLRPKDNHETSSSKIFPIEPEEASSEQVKKENPRELNPYLKNSGKGYPDESDGHGHNAGDIRLLSKSVVGDGGASWRLKALKRAQDQAAREGRKLHEVVEERWSSMGELAASVAAHNVAPTHAHLQAIKQRRKGPLKEEKTNVDEENKSSEKGSRHPKMRVPKVNDSLSWGKRGYKNLSTEDNALVSSAISGLNKFSNDGNFLAKFMPKEEDCSGDPSDHSKSEARAEHISVEFGSSETKDDVRTVKPFMSANQLAAKVLQLRMKGKHEEADKLLKEAETFKESQDIGDGSSRRKIDGTTSRFVMHDVCARQKKKEDDGDLHLAQKIVHNHRYNVSGQADEEYDYDDGPRKKIRTKGGSGNCNSSEITNSANRFLTQQDRCQFCFENPKRPKHLVIAIANFTYLMLTQQQPVVPGHCGILTLQHESSSRTLDDNVWDEIRNFKKCLIMMFAKQEKDLLFIETVIGLTQQRRHCMIECVPLPRDVAKQAPVYFKKAIDEAEDEWSQHNAKKLIDTSEKGLRCSIPKNFPYFHVEFGLNRGFVHVIDDEKEFKSNFGLNVIRGMLNLPAEDMHRRRRQESFETQKHAVANFVREWEPFDWTKQL